MPRTFFKIINELSADQSDKQRPLYLFSTKKEDNNRLSILISSCDQYCWIKDDKESWLKLDIDCLLARDGGSKTYYFKDHNSLKILEVPVSLKSNVQLIMKNRPLISMDRIRITPGELKNYPGLSGLIVSVLPMNEEVHHQLVLEEKKQIINKDIQYLESIKNLQQQSLENASHLSSADPGLSCLIEFVLEKCEQKIQQLNEQCDSLKSSLDESASAMATLKI